VLHWHGDTFDLPEQAELLANTELYASQAFRIGSNILTLQFHPEVASDSLEKWLIGHSCELSQAKIDIPALRAANLQFAPVLETTSQTVLKQYLAQLNIVSSSLDALQTKLFLSTVETLCAHYSALP